MLGFASVDSKPMCLECDAIFKNDSMKKVKLEHHQKSKHPLSAGKNREYFIQRMNTAKARTLKPSYLVSEIIAKVAAPQVRSLSSLL